MEPIWRRSRVDLGTSWDRFVVDLGGQVEAKMVATWQPRGHPRASSPEEQKPSKTMYSRPTSRVRGFQHGLNMVLKSIAKAIQNKMSSIVFGSLWQPYWG